MVIYDYTLNFILYPFYLNSNQLTHSYSSLLRENYIFVGVHFCLFLVSFYWEYCIKYILKIIIKKQLHLDLLIPMK